MKKFAATLAVLVVCSVSAVAADAPDAVALYRSKCASCHGKDGKGNAKMAKPLKVEESALSFEGKKDVDGEFLKATTDGRGKMPAYGKKLSAEEIKALVDYVHGLIPQDEGKDGGKKAAKKAAK